MGIPELGKPYYSDCKRLSEAGCSRYAQRPASCRSYRCAFQLGLIDERPNRTGILFDLSQGDLLGLFETEPGAWDRADVQTKVTVVAAEIFRRSAYKGVVLHRYNQTIGVSYRISAAYDDRQRGSPSSLEVEAIGVLTTPAGDITVYQPIGAA